MAYFLASLNWGEQVCKFETLYVKGEPNENFLPKMAKILEPCIFDPMFLLFKAKMCLEGLTEYLSDMHSVRIKRI